MENYLEDKAIRKAIAVYYLKEIIEAKGGTTKFAKEIAICSPPLVSRWINPDDSIVPTAKRLEAIAEVIGYSTMSMLQKTLNTEDKHEILENSEKAKEFRAFYNIGEERTHDSSAPHIANLRAFSGKEYVLFYLDPRTKEQDKFHIDRIDEPKRTGYLEIWMSRNKKENDYIGTIVAPPELGKAFIFLSQKGDFGHYHDRGMIVLCFPQERVRNSEGYMCGVGVAVTLDRHTTHDVLFQRVVLLQNGLKTDSKIKSFISTYLNKPITGGSVLMVSDLQLNQRELFSYIQPVQPTQEQDQLFDS